RRGRNHRRLRSAESGELKDVLPSQTVLAHGYGVDLAYSHLYHPTSSDYVPGRGLPGHLEPRVAPLAGFQEELGVEAVARYLPDPPHGVGVAVHQIPVPSVVCCHAGAVHVAETERAVCAILKADGEGNNALPAHGARAE